MRRAPVFVVLFALVLGLAAFGASRLRVHTSMAQFIPGATGEHLYEVSRRLADSSLTRQMVLTVGANDRQTVLLATRALEEKLRSMPGLTAVRGSVDESIQRAFYDVYFRQRYALAFDDPREQVRALVEGLDGSAGELKERLGGPDGMAIRPIAAQDPWLAFPRLLERLRADTSPRLQVVDGRLFTADGWGVLFLQLADSAFDGEAQTRLLQDIRGAIDATRTKHPSIEVEYSGANRFAVASERTIKRDVQRVSLLSVVAVVALFLFVFRSVWQLLLATLPLVVGMLTAVDVCLLLFGELHAITLAFGSALIGVCIDYPVHLQNHHALSKAGTTASTPAASAREIRHGLVLACATTVVGLVGLSWTDFPTMREMAVFATAGISAALLVTLFALPHLMQQQPRASNTQRRLAGVATVLLGRLHTKRVRVLLPAVCLVVMVVGLTRLAWSDRLRDLHQPDPTLLAEDERVRGRTSAMDSGRIVVSLGSDVESALKTNDAVAAELRAAIEAGQLAQFSSLHNFLWSHELQTRNLQALEAHPELVARTLDALERAGFDRAAFTPFVKSLENPPPPLTLAELESSALAPMIRPFVVRTDDQVALITFLQEVRDPRALEARLENVGGAIYFDQAALLDESYRALRRQAVQLMGLGLVFVVALVFLRYRRWRPTLAAVAPALLASGTTVGIFSLLGQELNLLHVISLLLVLSIGVDYGVFLVESRTHEHQVSTLVSLAVACLTTVCSFGALALSEVPALNAMGSTIAVGVLLSLLLAPGALLVENGMR